MSGVLQKNSIVLGDLLGEVGQQGDLEAIEPPISPWLVDPGKVSVFGVNRAGNHLGVDGLELCYPVVEGDDLSGTHKRAAQVGRRIRWAGGCTHKDDLILMHRVTTMCHEDKRVWSVGLSQTTPSSLVERKGTN